MLQMLCVNSKSNKLIIPHLDELHRTGRKARSCHEGRVHGHTRACKGAGEVRRDLDGLGDGECHDDGQRRTGGGQNKLEKLTRLSCHCFYA